MIKIANAAVEVAVKRIEASLLRPIGGIRITLMPFTHKVSLITGLLQVVSHGLPLQRQALIRMPLDGSVDAMGRGELTR